MAIRKEVRFASAIKRSEDSNPDEGKMIVEGYAVTFDKETLIGDEEHGFYEVIDKKAFDDADIKDVPLKYNHADNHLILARTRNGSLALSVDEVGLKVRAELLDTQSNRDIYKSIEAGLLDKMSFAFTVSGQSWDRSGETPKRTITAIDRLFDVSVVDLPAYDSTSIAVARSLEYADAEIKALESAENEAKANALRKRLSIKIKIGGNQS